VFGLHTHNANTADPFNETKTELDHVCCRVVDRAELEKSAARLGELGCPCLSSPTARAPPCTSTEIPTTFSSS
jgi:hypothetical protein